ncbi:rust resistance kinase Lr10-like [Senna tora]|uniref:Rust resistance kinase Lr10-like n=1 Tax=Senna tora TaxID=362788 RepID=A0A834WS20_9FABA|nr:rust resistance kinase Lr10-like [Senna tora]
MGRSGGASISVWRWWCLVLLFPVVVTQDQEAYCAPSSCGNITNISHPFRLQDDPPYCGDQRYELACENNVTVLHSSAKYHVLGINYNNFTIRLRDPHIKEADCSTYPLYSLLFNYYDERYYFPYSSDLDLLEDRVLVENIVYINCSDPVKDDAEYVDTAPCINWNSQTHIYAILGDLKAHNLKFQCRLKSFAPITAVWPSFVQNNTNLSYTDIHRVLSYGFELSWWRRACQDLPCSSHGSCYFNSSSEKLECRPLGCTTPLGFGFKTNCGNYAKLSIFAEAMENGARRETEDKKLEDKRARSVKKAKSNGEFDNQSGITMSPLFHPGGAARDSPMESALEGAGPNAQVGAGVKSYKDTVMGGQNGSGSQAVESENICKKKEDDDGEVERTISKEPVEKSGGAASGQMGDPGANGQSKAISGSRFGVLEDLENDDGSGSVEAMEGEIFYSVDQGKSKGSGEGRKSIGGEGSSSRSQQRNNKGKDSGAGRREGKERDKDGVAAKELREKGRGSRYNKEGRSGLLSSKMGSKAEEPLRKPLAVINSRRQEPVVQRVFEKIVGDTFKPPPSMNHQTRKGPTRVGFGWRDGSKALEVINKIKLKGVHKVDTVGYKGGIWLLWDLNLMDVEVLIEEFQFIHAKVKPRSGGDFLLTIVYGSPYISSRDEAFDKIKQIGRSIDSPWVVGGDFNAYISCDEKVGGAGGNRRSMESFGECVNDCGWIDLGYNGVKFAWDRQGLKERIDRFFSNYDWRMLHQNASVFHLFSRKSDHKPVLLKFDVNRKVDKKKRPFRFLASWLLDDRFDGFMNEAW